MPFLTNPALAAVAGGLIGLSCQGNSTAELNGVAIDDRAQRGRVHRHRRAVVPADRRPAALRELFARLQGGRLQSRPVGAQVADPAVRRSRRAAPRRWSATSSSIPRSTPPMNSASKYSRGPITLNVAALPPGFQELPAEHVQRHRLPRPDHQRLRDRSRPAPTATSARPPAPARRTTSATASLAGRRDRGRAPAAARHDPQRRPDLCQHQVSRQSGRQQHRRAARSGAAHAARATICPTRRRLVAHRLVHLDAADRQFAA